jgi:hypothetical protein
MILLMTVPSVVGAQRDGTGRNRIDHPHETVGHCGELRAPDAEPGVEPRREIVERILRGPVRAEHHMPCGGTSSAKPPTSVWTPHDAHIGIRKGRRYRT